MGCLILPLIWPSHTAQRRAGVHGDHGLEFWLCPCLCDPLPCISSSVERGTSRCILLGCGVRGKGKEGAWRCWCAINGQAHTGHFAAWPEACVRRALCWACGGTGYGQESAGARGTAGEAPAWGWALGLRQVGVDTCLDREAVRGSPGPVSPRFPLEGVSTLPGPTHFPLLQPARRQLLCLVCPLAEATRQ